ncbi:MAG: branched-chain amino acid ABC transporter permease/ATP-binding protein [Actinomycetota bacterium]|nr:branched-chain amino acid ABC transporter permease/ATP-binding protein [Actinomycetota bacterium]
MGSAVLAVWTTRQLWFDGVVNGMVLGLLALGVVLVYRSTRVINLAVGNMGLPATGLMALLVINYDFPYWLALPIALVVGIAVGALIERAVIRRLFDAPRVIVLVATIGIAQLMQAVLASYPDLERTRGQRFPAPLTFIWDDVLGLRITGPKLTILVLVPLLALSLSWFLNRTVFGQTVQASATNADLARLSGIDPKMVQLFVWTIAGLLATISLLLLSANRGSIGGLSNLGPNTMARALVAAVIAGMVSFPRALAAGVAIGVVQAHVQFVFINQGGLIDFLLFVLVAVAVAFQSRGSAEEAGSFSFSARRRPIPERLREIWWVRGLSTTALGLLLAIALVLPYLVTRPSRHLLYASILAFAICALSMTIVTGWAGQLSLGQMAFAGIGALFAAGFNRGLTLGVGIGDRWEFFSVTLPRVPYLVSMLLAAGMAAATAALIGLGALRVKGLLLAVTTFAFAMAAQQYLYRRPMLNGGNSQSIPFRRGSLGPLDLASQRAYYYLCLGILVVLLVVVARLRRSGIGRSIIGVRENENTAAAYTVSPTRTKLLAFSLAGGIAGLGGALLGGLVQNIPYTERLFQITDSLRLVSIVVIGGLGTLMGPVVGALWVVGLPAFWPDNDLVPLFTSSIGLLILLLYFPGGLIQITYSARDSLLRWAESRLPDAPSKTSTAPPAVVLGGGRDRPVYQGPALAVRDVSVTFGGLRAVDRVSIVAHPGEVVGLIGTNGAGKSTLMNAIGGFTPAEGIVEILGNDVSGRSASARARVGLGRTFQAARLFPELTVRETVQVALEARGRTGLLSTALFLPSASRSERAMASDASDLIDFLGLGRYADGFVAELSTGTRRIVELAGLLALDAQVLCLDEPTAGVAQRETEAFGPLLKQIQQELHATMIVIEHDMPMIMALSDRVYCLEAGQIIAEGPPDEVRNDPRVVASYLGTDTRAIDRSDS